MTDLKSNKKRKGHPQIINPVDEFCLPVQLPTNVEWVAAFIGAVRKLSNRSTWDYDAEGDYIVLADRWAEIADGIQNRYAAGIGCEAEICEDGSCTEIGAFHPALTYYPNNPITQPGYEAEYVDSVWVRGGGYIGADNDDAMIDIAAMAGQDIATMLAGGFAPSIELAFNGDGEIDVQFVSTIQGGLVWGYPDGNPLVGDLVNLEYTDILSLAGVQTLIAVFELVIQEDQEAFTLTHSWKFDTPGDHTLTLVFFPSIAIEPPFIGVGGGLRTVQLCGNATVSEEQVTAYTLDTQPDGTVRLLADAVPVSTVDLKSLLDDDYVNIEGDTMTGRLQHSLLLSGSNTEREPRRLLADDDIVFYERVHSNGSIIETYIDSAYSWRWREATSTVDTWFTLVKDGRILLEPVRVGSATSDNAGLELINNYGDVALKIEQIQASYDLARMYDSNALLKVAALQSGVLQFADFEGWGYSSTTTRRQQFTFGGGWADDTDATRRGYAAVDVYGAAGNAEVLLAEYDSTAAQDVKIGAYGNTPADRPPIVVSGQSEAVDAAIAQLNAIGWTDISYGGAPAQLAGYGPGQTCNAAYFIASQVSALINDIFDNLDTITMTEILDGMIADYHIPATLGEQIVLAVQTSWLEETGVLEDLTDPDAIAEQLLANDFDLASMLTWIDGYVTWQVETRDIVHAVLEAVWPVTIGFWTALGAQVQSASCGGFQTPCEYSSTNLRWSLGNWTMDTGEWVQSVGVDQGFDDPYYRVDLSVEFDGCDIDTVVVDWTFVDNTPAQHCEVHWWLYSPPDGAPTSYDAHSAPGASGPTQDSFNLSAWGPIYKVMVRLNSQIYDTGCTVQNIEVTPE